jgi:hypothetical protein
MIQLSIAGHVRQVITFTACPHTLTALRQEAGMATPPSPPAKNHLPTHLLTASNEKPGQGHPPAFMASGRCIQADKDFQITKSIINQNPNLCKHDVNENPKRSIY